MSKITNKLDSAYIRIDGIMAQLNYIELDFESRLKNGVNPKAPGWEIINTGYEHETSLRNSSKVLAGIVEELNDFQDLLNEANKVILEAKAVTV